MRDGATDLLVQDLRHLFDLLGITCVLDVGAHVGGYVTLLRRRVGFRGHVVSFEPAAACFERLATTHGADPLWRGHRYALGDRPDSAVLAVYPGTEVNSFLPPSPYGVARFPVLGEPDGRERVPVRRLTDVFAEVTAHVPDPRTFLKIDAQGYDLRVLDGAATVLDRVAGLQVEAPVLPIYEGMPTLPALLDHCAGLGFTLAGMFPVNYDTDGVGLVDLDCLLYRRGVS